MEQPNSRLCVVIVRVVRVSEIPMGAVCLTPGLESLIPLCCHHVIVSAIHFKNHQDGVLGWRFREFASVLGPIHTKRA